MRTVIVVNLLWMSMIYITGKAHPVRLPDFPNSLGIAGAYLGVSNNVVIVAGGSHFNKPQWSGGTKQLLDDIWVLRGNADGGYEWIAMGKLPFRVSNGASATTPQGVICVGGATDTGESDAVFLLTWDTVRQTVRLKELPRLPQPCAYLSAIVSAGRVIVAGGKNTDCPNGMDNWWMLDFQRKPSANWQRLGPLPSSRHGVVLASLAKDGKHYLLLGSGKSGTDYLTDLYRCPIDEKTGAWERLDDMPRAALVAPTVSTDGQVMWVLGGSDGVNITNRLTMRDEYHLNRTILRYDVSTDTWTVVGTLPEGVVSTQALPWKGGVLLVGGELGNAMRSRKVWLYNELITKK
ncbi:Kelch motif-containing protein [Parapedobacter indicus]|uniref:Kelch motif-containing protein n=2 Tax=Parapedobacter indicus TaxID=1477437 RepID=A0A1I3II76_9SPHI|nr:Kelch motif protein [Parapedobacter indicus]SFI47641.1 Kelch motif-containing protein [Parapedobacter indicus]